jgi:magnesium transporter
VAPRVEPEWLDPASGVTLWVDLAAPTPEEGRLLLDLFHFHPLSVEDALSELQYPKIEVYDGYLYLVLHRIHTTGERPGFETRDVDFFLGPTFLVTVHDGQSRSIARLREICERHEHALADGPVGALHRIVDSIVDHYEPEMQALAEQIDDLEDLAAGGEPELVRRVVAIKRSMATMRRVLIPQRDTVGRLARREFKAVNDEMAYRFRDVFDHVVRLADEALLFQDRVTGILEVNLATISNRLNQVMKLLTVMSTIFLPLTVLTGMWGMNIVLPVFPGSPAAQFWWMCGIMIAAVGTMLMVFRRNRWI